MAHHLLDTVRHTIAARAMFTRRDGEARPVVLVACSGGPDSTAMLHALARLAPELGVAIEVASVDHGLRAESAAEVAAVGAFARDLGLPFLPLAVRVSGPGLPAAAREARYEALLGAARERGARWIAVGHTRDDQAETVLARLLRGAGVAGLTGIEPSRADGVVRPLIDCSREDVLAYVAEHGLAVVSDPTNGDARYERTRIRNTLLPALEAEDPRVRAHLADLADEARAIAEHLDALADAALDAHADGTSLPVAAFAPLAPPVRIAALRRLIARETGRSPGRAHLEAIDALFRGRGEVLLPRGFEVVRDVDAVVLRARGACAARDALRRRTKRSGTSERLPMDTARAASNARGRDEGPE